MAPFEAQDFARRKLFAAARQSERTLKTKSFSNLPPALILSDPERTPDVLTLAKKIPRGWALIYRHFGHPERQAIIRQLSHLSRQRHFTLIVSADSKSNHFDRQNGLHWPKQALKAPPGRHKAKLRTTSAHNRRMLSRAFENHMDACLVSAVFPSNSPSAPPHMGAIRFRLLQQRSPIPLYALGGVNHNTAGQIAMCGGLSGIEGFSEILK